MTCVSGVDGFCEQFKVTTSACQHLCLNWLSVKPTVRMASTSAVVRPSSAAYPKETGNNEKHRLEILKVDCDELCKLTMLVAYHCQPNDQGRFPSSLFVDQGNST